MEIGTLHYIPVGTVEPTPWNENIYEAVPHGAASAESLEVINGRLDSTNLKLGEKVTNEMIRPRALAGGKMVGQTGNLDYPELVFGKDNFDHGIEKSLPGACLDFFLPFDCSIVIFQWYFSQTNTLPNRESATSGWTAGQEATSKVYVDDSEVLHGRRGFAAGWDGSDHMNHLDRCYSIHGTKLTMSKGWHTASLRVFQNQNFLRIRVRNVKVIWFK